MRNSGDASRHMSLIFFYSFYLVKFFSYVDVFHLDFTSYLLLRSSNELFTDKRANEYKDGY